MGSYLSAETPRVVFIEGNIGAGKSTVLDELDRLGHTVVREDVENWSFLPFRYANPDRWLFTLQVEIAASIQQMLGETLEKTPEGKTIFVERSLVSALLFAEVAHAESMLSEKEFALFKKLCMKSMEKYAALNTAVIYLDCDVDVCLNRIKQRNRDEEAQMVSCAYLEQLKVAMDKKFNGEAYKVDATNSTSSIVQHILEKVDML